MWRKYLQIVENHLTLHPITFRTFMIIDNLTIITQAEFKEHQFREQVYKSMQSSGLHQTHCSEHSLPTVASHGVIVP